MVWIQVLLCVLLPQCLAFSGSEYSDRDKVAVIASKVGPYFNSVETYEYYSLPFCPPDHMKELSHNLGEILSGDRKILTPINIKFKVPVEKRILCKKKLSKEQVSQFIQAVDQDYYFEMQVDQLPVWGYVGMALTNLDTEDLLGGENTVDVTKHFVYPHMDFSFQYNKDKIYSVKVKPELSKGIRLVEGTELSVEYSYGVSWGSTVEDPAQRSESYHKSEYLEATFDIHWLSIINSFVLVVLLTILLGAIFLRVLRNDLTRYMQVDEEQSLSDDSGWKLIHGDVFRFPENQLLFTAVIGAGTQLLLLSASVLVLVSLPLFSTSKKGTISTIALVLYALTATLGGYVSAKYYKQMGGMNCVWNTFVTAILFPAPLLIVFMVLNSIAIVYDSTAALPFGTIMIVFVVYVAATLPLTVLGAMIGKKHAGVFESPCRTTKVQREIPTASPLHRPLFQFIVAGFLPFSAIYIELHYLFASIWGHKVYTLFGLLILAFVLLVIVTSFITVGLIYFRLADEDHRWWWRSFQYGGAVGLFVYAYSIFYFFFRSSMSGPLQTSFFFGYMFIASYAFSLALGTVGFFSSLKFVRVIYAAIKLD